MKRIVTVQDISCVGKCSLTVALPIISAMGVEAAIIPTAVLSTHTMFSGFTVKDLTDQIEPITKHWQDEKLDFDAIYTAYAKLQEKQGFSLEKYKNRDVIRYTYEITNYPDYDGTVYVSLLIYKNKVVGGDVCSADVNGFVHGFEAPTG